jgi:hypothetical protein
MEKDDMIWDDVTYLHIKKIKINNLVGHKNINISKICMNRVTNTLLAAQKMFHLNSVFNAII